jgi:tRNA G18 (ribose-2'-O)-methylase SpoU
VDRYRYWQLEAIVADLDTRRHDFHVAIENWRHDFNIGTIVRTANAFLAAEVHIVGNRRWNRRGAMVTDRYQHLRHHDTAADLAAYLGEQPGGAVPLLGIDNLPGSAHLETMEMPRRVCFLFGQEGPGLSAAAREVCAGTFSIAQFGSTRSINASAAAAIAMHTWIRAHADLGQDKAWRG